MLSYVDATFVFVGRGKCAAAITVSRWPSAPAPAADITGLPPLAFSERFVDALCHQSRFSGAPQSYKRGRT